MKIREKEMNYQDARALLTDQQIKNDNPHFGPIVRTVEDMPNYQAERPDSNYLYAVTVGAHNSKTAITRTVDAWATYLFSPLRSEWVLGAN